MIKISLFSKKIRGGFQKTFEKSFDEKKQKIIFIKGLGVWYYGVLVGVFFLHAPLLSR
jgi:hypothetical protein